MRGGGMGVLGLDMTEAETLREALKRHIAAHDQTLDHLADAVAIFSPDKRLSFHNTAFAQLWGLEPAWLAERPSHGEVLDRTRALAILGEDLNYLETLELPLARRGSEQQKIHAANLKLIEAEPGA
jgi:PAS domain-containing protein